MPEEFIFFAVIIFFSIVESISRTRKARQQGQPEEPSDFQVPEPTRAESREPVIATYDADPSYDDSAVSEVGLERQETHPVERRPSTETMLPRDLFEELAGLAGQLERARGRARTLDLPKQSPPLPSPAPAPQRAEPTAVTRSKVAVGRRGITRTGPHLVHRAHEGYGTDPSERIASEQDGLDPLAESLGRDAEAIRRQLLSGHGASLRQAVMLREVLGKPVSLRGE